MDQHDWDFIPLLEYKIDYISFLISSIFMHFHLVFTFLVVFEWLNGCFDLHGNSVGAIICIKLHRPEESDLEYEYASQVA